nr:recombinase family protein [Parasedimentitalea psychrophila]
MSTYSLTMCFSATLFYARVSTAEQTLELQHTHALAAGFHIDEVIVDHGVSGVSTKLS